MFTVNTQLKLSTKLNSMLNGSTAYFMTGPLPTDTSKYVSVGQGSYDAIRIAEDCIHSEVMKATAKDGVTSLERNTLATIAKGWKERDGRNILIPHRLSIVPKDVLETNQIPGFSHFNVLGLPSFTQGLYSFYNGVYKEATIYFENLVDVKVDGFYCEANGYSDLGILEYYNETDSAWQVLATLSRRTNSATIHKRSLVFPEVTAKKFRFICGRPTSYNTTLGMALTHTVVQPPVVYTGKITHAYIIGLGSGIKWSEESPMFCIDVGERGENKTMTVLSTDYNSTVDLVILSCKLKSGDYV